MRKGVVFPQTEIGADPAVVRDYAQAAESLGYEHLVAYDHVLGANAASRPGWSGFYQHTDMFHEIFILFAYLAAVTQKLELVSGIMILPQRQTVLVAKQAAALDILSGGRLRLGIGIGWNNVEYEALGENFHDRGRRSEEQVEVLRALWTNELVTYEGKWHKITDAGLNPLPVQRPIPIWFGGMAEQVVRRTARLGDGWMPMLSIRPDDEGRATLDRLRGYAREAGRDPSAIGIENIITIADRSPEDWLDEVKGWKELGSTHVSVNTMKAGFKTPDEHIHAIERFRDTIAEV